MPTTLQRLQHRLVHEGRSALLRPLQDPSFTYKLLEMKRVRARMRELGTKDPAYLVDAKDDAHAWALGLGVRAPRLLAVVPSVDAVPWGDLGEEVVLKPARATTGTGVHLLRREGGRWRELMTRQLVTPHEIAAAYRALAERGTVSAEVVLEQLIIDPRHPDRPPIDYKVLTFYGTVGAVQARRRTLDGRGCWKFFDADWASLRNPYNKPCTDESLEPPVHADALLDVARRVSLAVPRPFLRVDLYEDAEGPVFGEVTPEPGGRPDVRRDVDRYFGRLWEEAEARLRTRFARAGVLTPEGLTPDPSQLDPRPHAVSGPRADDPAGSAG